MVCLRKRKAKNLFTARCSIGGVDRNRPFLQNQPKTPRLCGRFVGTVEIRLVSERVPYATREGMKIQLDDVLKQIREQNDPGHLIDDSIVREIEKEGFIDRVYGKRG